MTRLTPLTGLIKLVTTQVTNNLLTQPSTQVLAGPNSFKPTFLRDRPEGFPCSIFVRQLIQWFAASVTWRHSFTLRRPFESLPYQVSLF